MKAAVGDSFTYGEELEDRSNAWPTLLGYENYGLPGASNEYIFRTAIELAPTCTHIIVAWSECTRHEVYTHEPVTVHRHKQFQGLIQTNSRWTELPWFRELYAKYTQEEHQFTRTLTYMIALQSYLDVNNVDWRYCSAFSNQQMFLKYSTHPLLSRLNTERFIGYPYHGMVEWAYGTPHGSGGHPLEYGHQRIADAIQSHI
jgi:isopenicillin N synthase-like dioxygenase